MGFLLYWTITVADAPTDYRVVPSNYQLFLKKNSIVTETTENCNDMSFEKYYFKNFEQLPSLMDKTINLTGDFATYND